MIRALLLLGLLLAARPAVADDSRLTIQWSTQLPEAGYSLSEVCRITNKQKFQRGPKYAALSCQDYYARIIGLAGSGVKGDYAGWLYFCWALDPCGWPKAEKAAQDQADCAVLRHWHTLSNVWKLGAAYQEEIGAETYRLAEERGRRAAETCK